MTAPGYCPSCKGYKTFIMPESITGKPDEEVTCDLCNGTGRSK